MLALCKLIGVTEAPDNEIILLLIAHIQDHHSDFSKEEIKRAFSLATAEKLDFEFKHWNRITPQLLSGTLNSYKKFRSKELIKHSQMLEDKELQERSKEKQLSPEEAFEKGKKETIEMFEKYKHSLTVEEKKREEVRDWGSITYNFLDSIGCIEFSNKEKIKMFDDAKKILVDDKYKQYKEFGGRGVGKLIKSMENGKPYALIVKAKQIAIEAYFDSIIESNRDLLSLIGEKGLMFNTSKSK